MLRGSYLTTKDNAVLYVGDYIQSANRAFHLRLEPTGSLVVAPGPDPYNSGTPLWTSTPATSTEGFFAVIQVDGNLVVYRGTDPRQPGAPVWASDRYGSPGRFFLAVLDNGDLTIGTGDAPTFNQTLWWHSDKHEHRWPSASLPAGAFMEEGDYFVSPKGGYTAVVRGGALLVVRGNDPTSPQVLWSTPAAGAGQAFVAMRSSGAATLWKGTPVAPGEVVWSSPGIALLPGPYTLRLHDDARLEVPLADGQTLWTNGLSDPVVDVKVRGIDYDVAKATILDLSPIDVYTQHVKNHTTVPQVSTIVGSRSVTETSSWTTTWGLALGLSTEVKCGVPFLAEGKVEVSVEASWEYSTSKTEERSQAFEFQAPIQLNPGESGLVTVVASIAKLNVPYVLRGVLRYQSGATFPVSIPGTYFGTSASDVSIDFQLAPAEVRTLPVRVLRSTPRAEVVRVVR